MAKALTDDQRKMRLELVDFMAQGITTQVNAHYYTPEQSEYMRQQTLRVAKFLCIKN